MTRHALCRTFTKKFGNGAVNLLEARVIFANGSVATVNQYTHTDVFWTLRGGGGANTAVVVHFTARVHPAPRWFRSGSYTITTNSSTMFASAVAAVMRAAADAVTDHAASCGDGGIGFGFQPELGYSVGLSCNGYEANATAQDSLFTTLKSYVSSHKGDGVLGSHSSSNWNQSQYNPKKPSFPWMERHPDREISTELIGSMTKYFPIRGIRTEAGPHSLTSIVDGVVRVTDIISKMNMTMSNYVMFAKAQSGMSDDVVRRFNETSQNPVLLDARKYCVFHVVMRTITVTNTRCNPHSWAVVVVCECSILATVATVQYRAQSPVASFANVLGVVQSRSTICTV